MVAFRVGVDVFFEEFARETDGKEQGDARQEPEEFGADGDGRILRQCDGSGHDLPFRVAFRSRRKLEAWRPEMADQRRPLPGDAGDDAQADQGRGE